MSSASQPPDYFGLALAFFWLPENDGQSFHVTPRDPGGATNLGVLYRTWAGWMQQHGQVPTLAAFKTQTKDDFRPMLHVQFWNAARCDALDAAGIVAFDHAANAGPGNATRALLQVAGAAPGSILTADILNILRGMDHATLINRLSDVRVAYYRAASQAAEFPGWVPRAERCRAYALAQIGASPVTAGQIKPVAPVSPVLSEADRLNQDVLDTLQ